MNRSCETGIFRVLYSMKRFFTHLAILILSVASVAKAEPRMQALVPGLSIKRLPLDLTNINSVAYGPQGRLYAAAYDGKIYVLSDSDGDGLEDTAQIFWEKSGDLLTPVGMVATKEGLYLAVRGKIALLVDKDEDGVADVSETVVSGWVKEAYNSDRRNDASGIILDKEGNLYFSLGCMSYNKAWRLDDKGVSHYNPKDERGTILKVSPDRKHREILATGLRFVIGMDFNKHGDLFAIDQEGDTWFPGGNPRDELLHIIAGRHYGFPFRHAKYLPAVIDDEAVVGFSPQHQSTCGFRFNETRSYRKNFGPNHWKGDAIVTGFTRGKLWRAPLAKTRAGYVGKQVQFAAFESLPTDIAISPQGDLLLTTHGGAPDWGSGPAGKGNLYKITYDRKAPQPVMAWSASLVETKIAFDRAIDLKRLGAPKIVMGEFVWEGNLQEWILPGYEVVKAEKRAVRRELKVHDLKISDDGRTLAFTTSPQSWRARFGITLPGVTAAGSEPNLKGETIELSHDLSGVSAEWIKEGETQASWNGWLPHIDFHVIREFTEGSAEHEKLAKLLANPGLLRMKGQLLLPGKKVRFRFESNSNFKIKCGEIDTKSRLENGKEILTVTIEAKAPITKKSRGGRQQVLPTEVKPIIVEINTGKGELLFDASYQADFDPYERPLLLEHLFVPWAPMIAPPKETSKEKQLTKALKGDPEKGRKLFFGTGANCALCHTFDGKGGKIAADLTVSRHRGAEAVLRDIIAPNDSINPEYVSYSVTTLDGSSLVGLFRSANKKEIVLIDMASQSHTIQRKNIKEIQALAISLMPTGFEALGKEKLRDLVAFLCTTSKAKVSKKAKSNSRPKK